MMHQSVGHPAIHRGAAPHCNAVSRPRFADTRSWSLYTSTELTVILLPRSFRRLLVEVTPKVSPAMGSKRYDTGHRWSRTSPACEKQQALPQPSWAGL